MALSPWWLIGSSAAALCLATLVGFWLGRRRATAPLPADWRLDARPVLNADERQAMRLLREALPQTVIFAKLPLVRLCHPREADQTRYWFNLLEPHYISFAICSPNGRVLAAIDLDNGRPVSARSLRVKQGALEACRIRYVRCRADSFPPPSDLALLLRPQGASPRLAPMASPAVAPQNPVFLNARGALSNTVKMRRAQRVESAGDSRFAQDSFFAPASQIDTAANSDFPAAAADPAPSPPRADRFTGR